jgi:uncharacterized protein (TIGR00299 family) protein
MNNIAIIDTQIAGISGDMLLSSLIDAGASKKKVTDAIYSCEKFFKKSKIKKLDFIKSKCNGISCTKFIFECVDEVLHRSGIDMYRDMAKCCELLQLGTQYRTFALNSLKILILAEAKVHGVDFNKVKLHEASSIDTAADLIGTAVALKDLDLFSCRIYSTAVGIGNGILSFSHGKIPNPSNAILEIFKNRNFILIPGEIGGEITTPTGASMLVNLASESIYGYPPIIPEITGYGGGRRKVNGTPNVTRLLIGKAPLSIDYNIEKIYEIETNVDDITGEVVGNVVDKLYKNGAKDVVILNGITKKNRPTFLIKVQTDYTSKDKIIRILFKETGTLGCRLYDTTRVVMSRNIITMSVTLFGKVYDILVKISRDREGNIVNIKPEFDDVINISNKLNMPYKESFEAIYVQLYDRFKRNNNESA